MFDSLTILNIIELYTVSTLYNGSKEINQICFLKGNLPEKAALVLMMVKAAWLVWAEA